MEQVTLKAGEKIYQEAQVEELLAQLKNAREERDQANLKVQEQKILINQSIKVFTEVQKLLPGITTGKINGTDIMNIPKLIKGNEGFVNDLKQLNENIQIYSSKNPVLR